MSKQTCLSHARLRQLLSDHPIRDMQQCQTHFENCPECQSRASDFSKMHASIQQSVPSTDNSFAQNLNPTSQESSKTSSVLNQPLVLDVGDVVDGYVVQESVNVGGQGQVCLAYDGRLDRHVALKIGFSKIDDDEFEKEEIGAEGRLLAKINHPQLAQVYDCGVHMGVPYLVMEFVDGMNLSEEIQRGTMSTKRVFSILRQVCLAVQTLHNHGILHLDLKPENVMVTANGKCKLIDLGTAWVVSSLPEDRAFLAGTPEYMAPEQFEGENQTSHQTDVFGIGAILYFLLTGQPIRELSEVISGDHMTELEQRRTRLRESRAHRRLRSICLKATAIDPENRYPSVVALLKDINRWYLTRKIAIGLFITGMGSVTWGLVHEQNEHFSLDQRPGSRPLTPVQRVERTHVFIELRTVSQIDREIRFVVHSSGTARFIENPDGAAISNDELKVLAPRMKELGLPLRFYGGNYTFFAVQSPLEDSKIIKVIESVMSASENDHQDFLPWVVFGSDIDHELSCELTQRLCPESRFCAIRVNSSFEFEHSVRLETWLSLVDWLPTRVTPKVISHKKSQPLTLEESLREFVWSSRRVNSPAQHNVDLESLESGR